MKYLKASLVPVVQGLKVSLQAIVQREGCAQLCTIRWNADMLVFKFIFFFRTNTSQLSRGFAASWLLQEERT